MKEVLETLCSVLEEELERQQLVLEVVKSQQKALFANDIEYLEAKTAALEVLVREAAQAEAERQCVLRQVVERYHLPESQQTLSALIQAVPEPWKTRMAEFQQEFRATLTRTKELARTNRRVMRQSLRVLDRCFDALNQCTACGAEYDAAGNGTGPNSLAAAVLDQRG